MDRLAALEIFVRVVDTGSFSAVARHQSIGQPAVSKAVVQLEEWLGVSLLMRSTRSVVRPRPAGFFMSVRSGRSRRPTRPWWRREGARPASQVSFACRHRFALDGSMSFLTCRHF